MQEFFGLEMAERLVAEGRRADVILANNVFAHIPDINDFTAGMKVLLADDGVIHIENPSVRELIERCQRCIKAIKLAGLSNLTSKGFRAAQVGTEQPSVPRTALLKSRPHIISMTPKIRC